MRSLVPLITTLLPVAYALAVAAYARAYAREGGVSYRLGPVALRVAVLLHVFYLSVRGVLEGHLPLASVYDFLSATGLSMAVVYLYVEAREGIRTTGVFVVPFILLLQIVSSAYGGQTPRAPVPLKPIWFELHPLTIALGVGWIKRSGLGSLTEPKIWLTLLVWCVFAFSRLAYHRVGWRG